MCSAKRAIWLKYERASTKEGVDRWGHEVNGSVGENKNLINVMCYPFTMGSEMIGNETLSASLEDYIETIYLIGSENNSVRPKEIIARLGVTGPSVTEALHLFLSCIASTPTKTAARQAKRVRP